PGSPGGRGPMGGPWVSGGGAEGRGAPASSSQSQSPVGSSGRPERQSRNPCLCCSRGLNPPHRVKSISMTTFTEPEVLFLQARGNEACRKVWLGSFDPRTSLLPDSRDPQKVKEFLQEKYEKKRWYVSPDQAKGAASLASQSSTPEVKPQQTLLGDSGGLLTAAGSSRTSGQPRLPHQRTPQPAKKASTDLLADIGGDPFAAPQPAPAFAMFPAFPGKYGGARTPRSLPSSSLPCKIVQVLMGLLQPPWGSPVGISPNPFNGETIPIPTQSGCSGALAGVCIFPMLSRGSGSAASQRMLSASCPALFPSGRATSADSPNRPDQSWSHSPAQLLGSAFPAPALAPPHPWGSLGPGSGVWCGVRVGIRRALVSDCVSSSARPFCLLPPVPCLSTPLYPSQTGSLSSSPSSSSIQHPTPFLCTGARTAALGREGAHSHPAGGQAAAATHTPARLPAVLRSPNAVGIGLGPSALTTAMASKGTGPVEKSWPLKKRFCPAPISDLS
uniref:ArfGAP with FG repeats 2 n=1 Tax=Chelonoidis abingdonii TaxID=106734 RepID=A0A8C0JEL8_CHEAB